MSRFDHLKSVYDLQLLEKLNLNNSETTPLLFFVHAEFYRSCYYAIIFEVAARETARLDPKKLAVIEQLLTYFH